MQRTPLAGAGVVVLLLGLPASAGALSIGQLDGDGSCVAGGTAPPGCTAGGALGSPSALALSPDGGSRTSGRALGGSSEAVPSADGRSVYVLASLSSILPGAVTAFAVSP